MGQGVYVNNYIKDKNIVPEFTFNKHKPIFFHSYAWAWQSSKKVYFFPLKNF